MASYSIAPAAYWVMYDFACPNCDHDFEPTAEDPHDQPFTCPVCGEKFLVDTKGDLETEYSGERVKSNGRIERED